MRRYSTKLLIVLVVLAVPFVYGLAQYAADQSTAFLPSIVKSAQVTDMFDGYTADCVTVHWGGTQISVWVSDHNGVTLDPTTLPGGPYAIVYSDAPDGTILGQATQSAVVFTVSDQIVEDDWYVWMVDGGNQRASDIVSVHSDSELGIGNCQYIAVRFFSPTIEATPTVVPMPTDTPLLLPTETPPPP